MDNEQQTNNMKPPIDHFTDAAAILNLLDLRREYYGMNRGHSLSI